MITHKELTQRGFKLSKEEKFDYYRFKKTKFGGYFSDGRFHFYGMSTKGISVYELDMFLDMIEYGY
jgi:hypothetical protein|tara:strand:- start:10 stop:207 length:198 start_codon:yes stop_codon:yes gene_type:complete